ncbi:MAG: RHS repeat-associated core domain-containing protein, partial [Verrucomicrobiota bacterium]
QGAGGVGGLLATTYKGTQTTNCFAAYDGNGNVVALVNGADASIAAQYEYAPFGELLRATGPMAKSNPFRFSTKYQDDETDLLYYGYRFEKDGRWVSRDPIGENGGINLYGFVANDPLDYMDTDGRFTGTKCQKCGEWYQGWHTCPPPIDCSGYARLKGVSCGACGGKSVADGYPEKAQGFCEGFAKLYTGNRQQRNAACVAECLVKAEQECQASYQSCNRRNCCRYLAHFKCYAQCFFIPFKPYGAGLPDGAWEFGETTLRPACKSLLSKCPDCKLPNEL